MGNGSNPAREISPPPRCVIPSSSCRHLLSAFARLVYPRPAPPLLIGKALMLVLLQLKVNFVPPPSSRKSRGSSRNKPRGSSSRAQLSSSLDVPSVRTAKVIVDVGTSSKAAATAKMRRETVEASGNARQGPTPKVPRCKPLPTQQSSKASAAQPPASVSTSAQKRSMPPLPPKCALKLCSTKLRPKSTKPIST